VQGDSVDGELRQLGFYFTKSLPPKKYSKSPQNTKPLVEETDKIEPLHFKEDLGRTELKGEIEQFGQLLRLQKLERKQYISTDPADLFYRVNSRIIAFVEGTVHRSNLVHVRRATNEDSLVFSLVEPTEYPTEEMTRFTDALAVEKLLKQLEQDGIPDLFACRHRSHILEKLLPKYVKKYLEV